MNSTLDSPMQAEVMPPPIIPRGESALDFLRDNVPEIRIWLRESTSTYQNEKVTRHWREAEFVNTDRVRVDMQLDATGECDCARHGFSVRVDGCWASLLVTPHFIRTAVYRDEQCCIACDWVFEIGGLRS